MLIKLIIFSILTSIIFSILNHPLSLGMILLIQTLIIALITGMTNNNFWYSYILFLIMVGGMLILFIYMTSVASNEKFKFNFYSLIFIITISTMIILILLLFDNFLSQTLNLMLKKFYNMFYFNNLSLNKYIAYPNIILMFFIIIYLLITLIAVVKITNLKHGPLRQKC
uniref:NADH-ubiquinone oxidoreductase chain 6 n=1 Tax=Sphenophorus sp. BYU-CO246 TaxID=696090 RepID=D8WKM1_9CUCU|nr:NADH dehydrogenase subunit 6 [Sphenophorus sp. BYU-CO246]ACZ58554.1 NADH dehydrogenase subunit 6 [Sphenophorus sp. BYU-CO246]